MREWPVVALGDVLTLEYGKGLPADARCDAGKYPVYGANGEKGRTDEWLVDGPSVVVGRKGTAGAVTRVDGRFWPLDVTYFVACDPNVIDVDFLYYVLQKLELPSLARGVKPGINRDDVYALKMTLPPLAEQTRIVKRLDESRSHVFAMKAALKSITEFTPVLKESIAAKFLNGKSGWRQAALGDIARLYQPKTISKKECDPQGPYVVFGANGPIGRYGKFNHEDSQVTVTCRGATCGTVNVTPPRVWITGNSMVIDPIGEEVSKRYLAEILRLTDLSPAITGAAQPQITRASLSPIRVALPPREQQDEIATQLESATQLIGKLVSNCKSRATLLDELDRTVLDSLLQDPA